MSSLFVALSSTEAQLLSLFLPLWSVVFSFFFVISSYHNNDYEQKEDHNAATLCLMWRIELDCDGWSNPKHGLRFDDDVTTNSGGSEI